MSQVASCRFLRFRGFELTRFTPTSEAELAELISSTNGSFELVSTATKRSIGHSVQSANLLDLSRFSGVHSYEPEELILEAGAATPLEDINKMLAKHSQMLAYDPPHLMSLLGCEPGAESAGTLGGAVICNLSGPRRLTAGAARDHVLGLTAVDGRGMLFKAGGKVVKNVTGYDIPKLIAGSWGTLAAVTSLVVKVLPKPETEATLCVHVDSPEQAVDIMTRAMATPHAVSCASWKVGSQVYLRIEGIASSVRVRRDAVWDSIDAKINLLEGAGSGQLWQLIREVVPILHWQPSIMWRVSLPPSHAPSFVKRVRSIADAEILVDWAGGLVWIATSDSSFIAREHLTSGHATLVMAPEEMKQRTPVFHPQAPALAALSARVKSAFDPERKLNPGRMHKDL
jgi:glycolate oxidase FAD binding subunit